MVEKVTTQACQLKLSPKFRSLFPLPDPSLSRAPEPEEPGRLQQARSASSVSPTLKGWGRQALTWSGIAIHLPGPSRGHVMTLCKTTIKCPVHRAVVVAVVSKNRQPPGRFSFTGTWDLFSSSIHPSRPISEAPPPKPQGLRQWRPGSSAHFPEWSLYANHSIPHGAPGTTMSS